MVSLVSFGSLGLAGLVQQVCSSRFGLASLAWKVSFGIFLGRFGLV